MAPGVSVRAEKDAGIAVIVLDDAGVAVPGARVLLTGLTDSVHRVLEADAAGRVVFENLSDGEFTLAAEKDGFARGAFGAAVGLPPIPIALSQGTQFTATVVLQRLGAIAGTVADENGRPLAADVRIFRYQSGSSGRRLQIVAASRAGASGEFAVSAVAPGDYFVCARSTAAQGAGALVPAPGCFGGTREPSGTPGVRVLPAGLADGVNLFLRSEPTARLQGLVLDQNGQPSPSTQINIVRAVDDGFGMTSVRTGASGQFGVALPVGDYNLVVRGGGSMAVSLLAGNTTDVIFPLERGATLSGRLAIPAGETRPAVPPGATIFELVPAPSAFSHLVPAVPVRLTDASTLTFAATGIPRGEYEIRLHAAVSDRVPASAVSGDRDLLIEGVRIVGAEQLPDVVLTLTKADAELSGKVLGPDDVPVFDRRVLIFPADRQMWPSAYGRVRWAQPDTSGRFHIVGLPAGRFLLALVAVAPADEWTPALLEEAMADSVAISIAPGQRVVQSVRIGGQDTGPPDCWLFR